MSISILICCHNGERYLRETLESALEQTLPPDEIVLVDDGSTDGSADIARSFGPPVRLISRGRLGLPAARNAAIEASRSQYLCFMDADDLLDPTSLRRLFEAAGGREDVVPIMGFVPFGPNAEDPQPVLFDFEDFFPEIIQGNFGPNHNRLVSRRVALQAGCFDPTMGYFEDWLFWCRVALCGARLAPVPFVGAYYRRHGTTMSLSSAGLPYIRGHVRVMEELGEGMLQRPELTKQWSDQAFWCAWTAIHRARQAGIPWSALGRLRRVLQNLAATVSPELRRSRFVRLIRVVGVPAAESLQNFLRKPDANPGASGIAPQRTS